MGLTKTTDPVIDLVRTRESEATFRRSEASSQKELAEERKRYEALPRGIKAHVTHSGGKGARMRSTSPNFTWTY